MKTRTLILTVIGLAVVLAFLFSIGAPQVLAAGLPAPKLLIPANGSTVQARTPLLQWQTGLKKPPRDGCWVEVWKKDKNTGNPVDVIWWYVPKQRYSYPTKYYAGPLPPAQFQAKLDFGTQYWWHARTCTDPNTCGNWSATWTFTVYTP